MSCYVPTCSVPTCVPTCVPPPSSPICYPVSGLGSLSSGCGMMSSGGSMMSSGGGATMAASLGMAPGASVGCINQLPASEVVIQPSPAVVTIPGTILSASSEPVRVGGYTACATGPSGSFGRASRSMMYSCRPYICRS